MKIKPIKRFVYYINTTNSNMIELNKRINDSINKNISEIEILKKDIKELPLQSILNINYENVLLTIEEYQKIQEEFQKGNQVIISDEGINNFIKIFEKKLNLEKTSSLKKVNFFKEIVNNKISILIGKNGVGKSR
jgi:hypothetical protein